METQFEHLWIVLAAAGLGGVLGIEREIADKPAGLRTHMLVAAASAMFVLLGDAVVHQFAPPQGSETLDADPIRIIQAIVIGVSFLGAGTIMHHRGKSQVEGLTTAASILLTCGIGIAAARHLWWFAGGTALLALLVLLLVGRIERWLRPSRSPGGEA